jgi:hypothetical protein
VVVGLGLGLADVLAALLVVVGPALVTGALETRAEVLAGPEGGTDAAAEADGWPLER